MTRSDTSSSRARVEFVPDRRYPYAPVCDCGEPMRGYVAEHAARIVADAHVCADRPVTP